MCGTAYWDEGWDIASGQVSGENWHNCAQELNIYATSVQVK